MTRAALSSRAWVPEAEPEAVAVVELWAREPAVGCEGEEEWFQVLSYRLLLQALDEEPASEFHTRMIRAAHEAAMLAWSTPYPLLVFPCLFQERAQAACKQAREEAKSYWRTLLRASELRERPRESEKR